MDTKVSNTRQDLIDATRMEDVAMSAGRSAEALFGYLSRLDALRNANLDPEMLAERAAQAELHSRVVFSAGMDALNELNDFGLLSNEPTDEELDYFNETRLKDALVQMADTFRKHIPNQRWEWLEAAGRLVEGVEVSIQRDKQGLLATITHSGQSTVVCFDPKARSTRVSTNKFFSNGPDRIYVPSSAFFSSIDRSLDVVSPYDSMVQGMAFAREWIYRHARNASELGPPALTGGGPVIAVIIVVLVIASAVASVAVAILAIACQAGSDTSCRIASWLGLASTVMSNSAQYMDAHSGQPRVLSYGTNLT